MAAPPTAIEQPSPTEPGAATDIVVFDSVSIAFDEKPVLEGISFRLAKGETKAIFGVAGSGKSTILKLALGLLKPDAGHIYVLGEDVTQMPEDTLFDLRRQIGMVFQESALFDSLTVRENVAFRLLEEGDVSDEEVEKRVREALRFVELEDTVDKFPQNSQEVCVGALPLRAPLLPSPRFCFMILRPAALIPSLPQPLSN